MLTDVKSAMLEADMNKKHWICMKRTITVMKAITNLNQYRLTKVIRKEKRPTI